VVITVLVFTRSPVGSVKAKTIVPLPAVALVKVGAVGAAIVKAPEATASAAVPSTEYTLMVSAAVTAVPVYEQELATPAMPAPLTEQRTVPVANDDPYTTWYPVILAVEDGLVHENLIVPEPVASVAVPTVGAERVAAPATPVNKARPEMHSARALIPRPMIDNDFDIFSPMSL